MKYRFTLLAFLLLGLYLSSNGQSITLSLPASGSTYVNSCSVVFSISEPAGNPQSIKIVWIYTAGYYYSTYPPVDTFIMVSNSKTASFTFKSDSLGNSSSVFTSSPETTMPDGTYSVYCEYVRPVSGSGATVVSAMKTNVKLVTQTLPPAILLPANSSIVTNNFIIKDSVPEAYANNTKTITFRGPDTAALTMVNNTLKDTFALNVDSIASSYIQNSTASTLSDGVYTMTLSYQDSYGHPADSVSHIFTLDTHTQPPVISAPIDSGTIGYNMNLNFTLPETPFAGSVKLLFNSAGLTDTIALKNISAGTTSMTLNSGSISSSSYVQTATSNSLSPGIYTITLFYQDALANPAASASVSNVTLRTTTIAPVLISPADSSYELRYINVKFNLPEAPTSGTVKLTLSNPGLTIVIGLNDILAGADSVTLDTKNISGSPGVLFHTGANSISNGIYTVGLSYQNSWGNFIASDSAVEVTVHNSTDVPAFITPVNSSTVGQNMHLNFNIPDYPLGSSAKLIFNTTGLSDTLVLKNIFAGTNSFTLDTKNISNSAAVLSYTEDSLSGGIYTITLSYQDSSGDAAASVSVTNVNLDNTTQPPVFLYPVDSSTIGQNLTVIFNLPEAPLSGSVDLLFNSAGFNDTLVLSNISAGINEFTLNTKNLSSSSDVLTATSGSLQNGIYTIAVSYQDYLGNPAASVSVLNENISNVTVVPSLSSPENNYMVSSNNPAFVLSFAIPEIPSAGSVLVVFSNNNTTDTAFLNINTAGNYSFALNPEMLDTSAIISSFNYHALADGAYNVVIEYKNAIGNPLASSNAGTMIIDNVTLPPTLILPGSFSTNNSMVNVDFYLPEYALNNTAYLTLTGQQSINLSLVTMQAGFQTFTLNGNNLNNTPGLRNTTQSTIPDGIYTLVLSYQDTLGNPAAIAFENSVAISNVTPPPVIATTPINPDCNMTADLSTAITSDTSNLTFVFYSDSALTVVISNYVTAPGIYYVKATNTYGLSNSNSILVEPTQAKPLAPAALGTSICSGSSASLSASGTGTIVWYTDSINGAWLGTGSNYTTAALAANTTFYVEDSTCVASASRTPVIVTINALPIITANATATTVCAGTSVTLSGGGAASYIWTGGVNDRVAFVPDSSDTYTVTGTDVNNCSSTATITIQVNPLPVRTTTLSNSSIIADQTGATYQWLNCNNNYSIISGETGSSLTSGDGNYAVTITLSGCTDTSDCVNLITTAVNELENTGSINLYPNPVADELVIENKGTELETDFKIFNSVGELVSKGSFVEKTLVETGAFSAGVYLIKLENEKEIEFKKFVKE